jgi:hypothetical protein
MQKSMTSKAGALAAMALMAAAGGMTAQVSGASETGANRYESRAQSQPIERSKAPGMPSLASLFRAGIGSGSRGSERRRGPGWTNAHAKRVSVKARNVRRHRAANR